MFIKKSTRIPEIVSAMAKGEFCIDRPKSSDEFAGTVEEPIIYGVKVRGNFALNIDCFDCQGPVEFIFWFAYRSRTQAA